MREPVEPEEAIDLVARYIGLTLNIQMETHPLYAQTPAPEQKRWKRQLEEAKRELIAARLAKQI